MSERPDPDALLAQLGPEGRASARGRLKIFFGAAAGVGKTFAMLQEARDRLARGDDVLVGTVETHGRPETETLRTGLPELPPRKVVYRGHALGELDLDAALARRPALLLVDELAHTNAPGSRHERRFQDVEELLAAGVNVYTTLNVQHLESLNDVVAQITGITVRETVPDSVLEAADEVELIDLPPDELLARLRDGKVYIPEQARIALGKFFRKANLIALREMALRCTADRVDAQMEVYRQAEGRDKSWPVKEKVLVCISPSPSARRVVRAGRRLAARLRADWTVLYVEAPRHLRLPQEERDLATQALRLAQQLGGEPVTLSGHDAVEEILTFARARNVSRIVVGKPGSFWRLREILSGSFVTRLARASGEIDVFIVHGERGRPAARLEPADRPRIRWGDYGWAVAVVTACTAVVGAMFPWFEVANLAMMYILGVALVAARRGRGPSILSAILSVAVFDYLFVPPFFTFAVSDVQYLITFAVMLFVALVISALTVRIREQAAISRLRERRTAALLSLSRQLASTRNLDEMISAVRRQVDEVFEGETAVYLAREDGRLEMRDPAPPYFATGSEETAVAQWVHEHVEPAGVGTTTLAGAQALHLPLVGGRGPVGVLALRRAVRAALRIDEMHLLETFANQTALALERALLARAAHRQRLAAEGERLRNALLAAVSHDLRTPLAAISGAASSLVTGEDRLDPSGRRELALTIHEESERMNRLANNLLEMGRLQAEGVVLQREWQPIEEVVGSALAQLDRPLHGREVRLEVPEDLPLVPIDDVLIERVLVNLLENATHYTPPGSPIEIVAAAAPPGLVVEVRDRGPGLGPGEEREIFERFFRGETGRSRHGAGLGLAVSRVIVEAHGGTIVAENRSGGGACFRFTLPITGAPAMAEAASGAAG